jgi:peroxiredoxin Q/BCP
MLATGQPAPEFQVPDHQNRQVRLRDLRGRKVLLWFYPKADTPG